MKILAQKEKNITHSQSILSFETTGGGTWDEWDRYLCIDGKKAYHIGNICGTCNYFFERLGGANQKISPAELSGTFQKGLSTIDENTLDEISLILPNGAYQVTLLKIQPDLIKLGTEKDYFAQEQVELWGIDDFWGLPHNPKINYYRGDRIKVADHGIYEFIVPMFPQGWLDSDTVDQYKKILLSGGRPTALSLSVLDSKEPADGFEGKEISKHSCLAHYILDGHHKIFAANQCREPLTLLSFLAVDQGISTQKDIDFLWSQLQERAEIS